MGTFNLPASFKARPGQVDPGLRRGKKIEAFKIHHSNPQNGRNPLPGYLSIDLFSEELQAGSVYTEREIMIIGEECERVLARLCANPVGFCFRVGMLKRGSMPRRASGWRAERGFLPCPGIGLKSEKARPPRVAGAQRRGRH